MTTKIYDGYLLSGDTQAVESLGILVGGNPASEIVTERLALSVDARIPRNAVGYIDDLCNERLTRAVRLDRLRMLSRFVEIVMPPERVNDTRHRNVRCRNVETIRGDER